MSAHAEAAGHGQEHHHGPPIANKSSKVDATVLGMVAAAWIVPAAIFLALMLA